MRTILLGTDFAYNKDGNLLPIEINTNVAIDYMSTQYTENIFDLEPLRLFILNNSFTKVTYIGGIHVLNENLDVLLNNMGIMYEFFHIYNSSTIPQMDDTLDHLIIRSAYDYNAIVDTEYCANKVNFLNLIKNENFGSQFAYLDDTNTLVNNITIINDNGVHPNFILKSLVPKYDRTDYPKLFKITTQQELDVVLSQITDGYVLMEYYYTPDALYDNLHTIIRTFNLLFPPNLESITIGSHKKFGTRRVDGIATYNPTTFELDSADRPKYLTSDHTFGSPKLGGRDFIELADGTLIYGDDLQVGDFVRTVIIPNPYNVSLQSDIAIYNIDYDTFVNETTYTSNEVLVKKKVDKFTTFVRMIFDDGTFWGDAEAASYMVLRDNIIRFVKLDNSDLVNGLKEGDQIVLLDTSQVVVTPILKTVVAIVRTIEIFSGYQIEVAVNHTFLSRDSNSESAYLSIEHNVFCSPDCVGCGCSGDCGKGSSCFKSNCDTRCPT